MVLACDGIYDVMENDELCAFVEDRLQVSAKLDDVCNQVYFDNPDRCGKRKRLFLDDRFNH